MDFPKTGINKYVSQYISKLENINGKTVLDIPAGDGRSSYAFHSKGAVVHSYDLFPSFFKIKDISCRHADLQKGVPEKNESMDYVICQEGIEHMANQYQVFCEFNRVLKTGGYFLLTTPNLSNARSRLSMFLLESEFWKRMPPSEVDSVWFSEENNKDIYFGHIFLMSIQKIRTLATLAGFEIEEIVKTKTSPSSVIYALLFYPFFIIANLAAYFMYVGKNRHVSKDERKKIFREQVCLNLSFKILTGKHIFVVFKKVRGLEESIVQLKRLTRDTQGVENSL